MRNYIYFTVLLGNLAWNAAFPSSSLRDIHIEQKPKDILQILLVTTASTTSIDGVAQRYERKNEYSPWQKIGHSFPIVVGKRGLAWDPSFQNLYQLKGPVKQEGDNRSPAGIFRLTYAFGFAKPKQVHLPYLTLQSNTVCVDDAQSSQYNRIITAPTNPFDRDWKSAEWMRTVDLYEKGIVVHYNGRAVKHQGSCIFLHLWHGKGKGTAGCTAMPFIEMNTLQHWLDIKKSPLLIQSTRSELPEVLKLMKALGFESSSSVK